MADNVATETTEAPPAEQAGETTTSALDLNTVEFVPESTPTAEGAAAAGPEVSEQPPPAASAPERAEPPQDTDGVERRRGSVSTALRQERAKTQDLRRRLDRYRQVAETAAQPISEPRPIVGPALKPPVPRFTAQELQRLSDEAENAKTLGDPLKGLARMVESKLEQFAQGLERSSQEALATAQRQWRADQLQRQERVFARDHPDYYAVVQRSGIGSMVAVDPATGRPAAGYNDKIAREIADASDQVEAVYWIAKGLLGEHPEADEVPVRDLAAAPTLPARSTPSAPVQAPVTSTSQGPPVSLSAEAEAERRGAQRVVDRVAQNTNRPRGVRGLEEAGQPRRVVLDETFRQYLYRELQGRNPEPVLTLFRKRPDIERWYES